MTLLKRNAGLVLLPLIASLSSTVFAKGEVTRIETELRPATPSSYEIDGQTYEWGVGEELVLKSIEVNGELLDYGKVKLDAVIIRRVANDKSTGAPCSVFAAIEGGQYKFQPSYPGDVNGSGDCDYGSVVVSNVINQGSLDLFANDVRETSIKNIERIDLVFSNGVVVQADAMEKSGYAVVEKSGNNHIQVAAILELDSEGNPSKYGALVMVRPHDDPDSSSIRYGLTDVREGVAFLANENRAPQGFLRRVGGKEEVMGVAFVSVTDLGLEPDQTYFGVSLFGADVDANNDQLTDPKTFPLNTGVSSSVILASGAPAKNAGDADVVVGVVGDIVAADPGDGAAGASSGSSGNVAEDTETKEVLDVVETVVASNKGGGALGFALVLLLGARCFSKPLSAIRLEAKCNSHS